MCHFRVLIASDTFKGIFDSESYKNFTSPLEHFFSRSQQADLSLSSLVSIRGQSLQKLLWLLAFA